jgi:Bifunctional DNA primase/polymerase, N-terminal
MTMNAPVLTLPFRTVLRYCDLGWPVAPLAWAHQGVCCCSAGRDCASPAKHPLTEHGYKDATTDRKAVMRWWRKWPRANVGIATGAVSGLVVLDVDPRNGGSDSLKELLHRFGRLAAIPAVLTGGGGKHFYFSYDGLEWPKTLGPGLDVLSDGRMAVAPFSEHVTGQRYRWVVFPW